MIMSITQILVFVFGIIKISSIGCDYIVNPETKDNRFYREDSYVYVEDKSENVKSRSLSKQGEKRLGYLVRCALTNKDNDVCLTDGYKEFKKCAEDDNIHKCGYLRYMFRCCPEFCRGKGDNHTGIVMPIGNFTQKACRKLFDYGIEDDFGDSIIENKLGKCDYPFYSRVEDCSIQVDWEMVARGERCNGLNERKGEKVAELTDCAELCRKNSSKWFMYGTNDNPADTTTTKSPEKGCDNDEEECKCICETSLNCERIPDTNFDLYKYVESQDLEEPWMKNKNHLSFEESQINTKCKGNLVINDDFECYLAASLFGLNWFGKDSKVGNIPRYWFPGCSYHVAVPPKYLKENLINSVALKKRNVPVKYRFPYRSLCKVPEQYYVDDGCPNTYDEVYGSFQSKDSYKAFIRCCSNDGTSCKTVTTSCYDPTNAVTYDDAVSQCESENMRLCTKNELFTGVCCGTGGGCNKYAVWTSTGSDGFICINGTGENVTRASECNYIRDIQGIGLCNLVSKDSDICLQHSMNWTTFDGDAVTTWRCSESISYCDKWEKDVKRCCPETCNSTQFTKESCLNSTSEGSCVYPFRARYGDCYEHQKIDCKWGNKICNECNVTCGGGKKICNRPKDVEARNGGKDCEGDKMSIEDCNYNIPCPVDCQWTTWECSECSKTCIGGYKNCNRTIITEAKHDGKPCSGTDSGKSEACLGVECPVPITSPQTRTSSPFSLTTRFSTTFASTERHSPIRKNKDTTKKNEITSITISGNTIILPSTFLFIAAIALQLT